MKTVSVSREDAQREWLLIDLDGLTVGRAATKIASVLRGKHKPSYTPHADTGDFVVAVNAEKVKFTGNKMADKIYYRHSHHPGGLREMTAQEMLARFPDRVITLAVRGMLPKNALGREMLKKFRVYTGPTHPHEAQQPRPLTLS
jgi:large subunit ribosomal protein L13